MITTQFSNHWHVELLAHNPEINQNDTNALPHVFKTLIEKILLYFDNKDYFYALFYSQGVSPFIATHDYVLKVLHCATNGYVTLNISPIYHLGLEYPDNYEKKHGEKLTQDAVIGLIPKHSAGTILPEHQQYAYGIDAGILFADSKISHNKTMHLNIEHIRDGLQVTFSCSEQSSSISLAWHDIGWMPTPSMAEQIPAFQKKDAPSLEQEPVTETT